MGRQSREHREKWFRRTLNEVGNRCTSEPGEPGRIGELEAALKDLADGDAVFWAAPNCPFDIRESDLEDVLQFESVGSGVSLFEGMQQHGLDLPRPETLDERQSARKVMEVFSALEDLRIFLIGFEAMSPSELYSTLWNQTLWEGCYVRKRNPGSITLIDVSHKLPRSEMLRFLQEITNAASIH
jgi:hypothetical protein